MNFRREIWCEICFDLKQRLTTNGATFTYYHLKNLKILIKKKNLSSQNKKKIKKNITTYAAKMKKF